MKARTLRSLASILAIASQLACSADGITGVPVDDTARERADLLGVFGPRLLYCPSSQTYSVSDTVGVLGGLLSVAGTTVSIPAGALLGPTPITLTVPASRYMEIDVSVDGTDSFVFEQPITMRIGYSRCTGLTALLLPLTAWHIDSETKALLEPMVSLDSKLLRTVTFTTIHLSGYALAN